MIGRSIRVRLGFVLALSTMGVASSGCGDGDFVPPPPSPSERAAVASRAGSPTAAATLTNREPIAGRGTVRRIDYIMSSRTDPDEVQVEVISARVQAGFERARLHIYPEDDTSGVPSPSSKRDERKSQAEWIREAVADRTRALIIDPTTPKTRSWLLRWRRRWPPRCR